MPPASRPRSRTRWLPVGAFVVVVAVALVIVLTRTSPPTTGYDISYPQCSGSFPNPLFGIVGVNGGVASTINPCVGDELQWARGAPGQKRPTQPPLSLYLDAGNPGAQHIKVWPRGGTAPTYGACNGLLTDACSYIYGEQRSIHSYGVVAKLDPAGAMRSPWWLDVELAESWAGTYELNVAALQGFIAGLREAGATGPIGIYSTVSQWKEITGLTAQTTPSALGGAIGDWIAGTGTLRQARQNCATGDFTGVMPTLAQYQIGGLDADLRCPAPR